MHIRNVVVAIGAVAAVVAGLVVGGPAPTASAAAPSSGRFTPVTAARAWSGKVGTSPTTVALGGRNGIPSTATAVVLTATVSGPTASGYVSVAPGGSGASPSIQNFAPKQSISGTTTVGLVGGKAQVKVSSGTATVALDVAGWYGSSSSGSTYTPLAPTNVLTGTVGTGATRIAIAGRAGVPSDATAVVFQADVSRPAAAGTLRITPAGSSAGIASVTYQKGVTVANTVTVGLSGGAVQARVSAGSARALADVVGYYAPRTSGSVFVPSAPVRAATVAAGTTAKNVTIAGTAGVPRNAVAAVINAKVGKGSVGGSLRVVGAGLASSVPTQVYAKGQTIGNALIAPLASGGRVSAKVSAGTATAYVDVVGYFIDGSTGSGTGVDVSWPQCAAEGSPNFASARAPADRSFAIVGVNARLGANPNTCFDQEFAWARNALGGTAQPKTQLYSLFQNPGARPDVKWPTSNLFLGYSVKQNPYGSCTTQGDKAVTTRACSYVYGYGRASVNAASTRLTNLDQYRWWLDVEEQFSYQSDTSQNRAAIEGMLAALRAAGVRNVGVYSTTYQFGLIMGTVPSTSPLRTTALPSWIPIGDGTLAQAQAACSGKPLLGGPIAMTQYKTPYGSAEIDRDWSCR